MRVIVCIKQVGYVCHPIALDRKDGEIDPEKMVYMLNPYDEVAMEEAVRLKSRLPGTEIVVLSAGPSRAEAALRYAFSLGADQMIRINSHLQGPWSTAAVLASLIGRLDYDIILCGKKAIDSNDGMVGPFLAELLDIGLATGIVKLEVFSENKTVLAERSVGRGDREVVKCRLPALFTVDKGLNAPRYPTLPHRLRAEKSPIQCVQPDTLDMAHDRELDIMPGMAPDLRQFTSISPPRPKPKKAFTPDTRLSASERMRLIMSGGGKKTENKGDDLIEGTPDEVAEVIVKALVQEKIV